MNREGARLARQAADEVGGFVAGSLGPLNVALSVSAKVDDPSYRSHTFDQVREAYAEQILALVEGGVDLLLIETIFDTLNAKAAIAAALEVAPDTPRWISFTAIDISGRNLSGQTPEAFWASIEHAEPLIVGVELLARRLADASLRRGPRPHLRHVRVVPSECRPAERVRRVRRAARRHEPLPRGVRRVRASST